MIELLLFLASASMIGTGAYMVGHRRGTAAGRQHAVTDRASVLLEARAVADAAPRQVRPRLRTVRYEGTQRDRGSNN